MNNTLEKKIKAIKEFALNNVPFYKQSGVITNPDSQNFNEFPIITKDILRANSELFLSRKERLVAEFTSGSTGFPLTLYKTKSEMMYLEALLIRERKKAVSNFEQLKLIKFYAELHTGENRCYDKIHREHNILYLSMLHMDPESMSEYARVIQNDIEEQCWIMGPPSVISRFAQYVFDSGIELNKIQFVEFTGEMLSNYQREITKKAFHCTVRNHYGSREFWAIAYECECGQMHILKDHVFAENSDHGLLVSTLDQRTMPLIRYCVGDHCVVSDKECACGNSAPVLETFGGRTTDFIVTPSGKEISSILIYMIIVNMNLIYRDVVRQFKVIQTAADMFEVYIVSDSSINFTEEPLEYFCEQMQLLLGYTPQLVFHHVDHIPVDAESGKFKYFVSKMRRNKNEFEKK